MTSTGELAWPSYGSALRTTPITRAPCQVAICVAACPTLPLTPITSTVSPALGMPARRKPSIAVTKGTPMPAASSHEMLSGFSTTASASTTRCVAWVPSRRMPRSPDEPNTSRPIQPCRAVDHDARIVAARRAREYGIGHQPGRGLHVGRIDGRGLELDQQIIFAARQRVRLDHGRDRRGIGGLRRQADAARLD